MPFNLKVVSTVLERMGFTDFPTIDFCRNAECISFEAWARKIGVPESRISEYINSIHEGVTSGAHSLPIFDGVSEFLKIFSIQNDLGVITASASEAANNFLMHHGIRECFCFVAGGEMVGSKSEKIFSMRNECACSAENIYFVGDAGTDIQQGKLAGVKTIAVTWGFQGRSRLEMEKPDFIVDNIQELSDILNA